MEESVVLTKAGCRQRIGQMLERLQGECGAIVIADPRHIGYLAGFFTNPATINLHSQSFLLVEPDGRSTLITDNWQADAARSSHADCVEIFNWYNEERPAHERRQLALQTLLQHLQQIKLAPRMIGIERDVLAVEASERIKEVYPGVTFRNLWDDLIEIRKRKLPDEVVCIRHVIRACEAGYASVRRELRPGMTELDVYSIAYSAALLETGEPISAVGDFISGPERTAAAAGPPTRRVMLAGELLIMDFFMLVGGYRADLCNTFVVGVSPTDEQRRRFSVLEAALRAAEETFRPGTKTLEIYQAIVGVMAGEGMSEGFWTHAGHGLGLDHPEAPFIVRHSDEILQEGNVIAVEPGFYLKGWGGMRIEDNYLITGNGFERLSHHVKGF
jgi:Xaa-Pro aminopeptidase